MPAALADTFDTLPHIVLVDDDPDLRTLVSGYLSENGFQVSAYEDGRGLADVLRSADIALLLLDIRLPGPDGLALLREARQTGNLPVILLTGASSDVDRVVGLELGADDYIAKPFNPRELLARVRAVLRRAGSTLTGGGERLRFAGWTLDVVGRRLEGPDGTSHTLPSAEFNLLLAFLRNPGKTLSRDQLLEASRDDAGEVFDRSIDVQIFRLRRRLETDPSHPEMIMTERGQGYRFSPKVLRA
ncbi:MAG: response regulator [Alphaproteobacteria bacterium]|nr:response regulator [Alphaproteobacteria bacterium]TAD88341.1 MAG: response regulator [Alphaproteobacteria bacterium]